MGLLAAGKKGRKKKGGWEGIFSLFKMWKALVHFWGVSPSSWISYFKVIYSSSIIFLRTFISVLVIALNVSFFCHNTQFIFMRI